MNKLKLDENWRTILKKAWSVKFLLLAASMSGAEVILPFFSLSIPREVYLPLIFLVTVLALISRFVAQAGLNER